MKQEYSFTLTVPLGDIKEVEEILQQIQRDFPKVRISRKTDRKESARFYMSFPFSDARPDLAFQKWFETQSQEKWDLYGPTYGRWGLC